jgi:hypothetical protein
MKTRSLKTRQGNRLLAVFRNHPNEDLSAATLSRIASGKKNGWCASFTRKISDLRQLGYNIIKSRDEWHAGRRETHYRYQP